MLNFEVASANSFRDIKTNHFLTAAETAEADIEDSIKRKRFRVSLKKWQKLHTVLDCTENYGIYEL